MSALFKLCILLLIGIIVVVYTVMPYINGIPGPYHTVTYTTKQVIKQEQVEELGEQVLYDRYGNVVE